MDHLRKLWKQYAECFDNEIGLGINAGTGMLETSDDPHCEPFVNADPMEVEGPPSSRARPTVNKGKGLATSVHLFKPICKKPKKKKKKKVQLRKRCQTF